MSAAPKHSTWSASGFEQKMLCPGSHVLCRDLPSETSVYAAEGTAAHQVLTWALQSDMPASAFVGRVIDVEGHSFVVDDEMAGHVQVCVDYCRDIRGEYGVLLVDEKVNYAASLGLVDKTEAWGTADVILLLGDEIVVVDFKYGRGVMVEAAHNPQMSLYALGALEGFGGLVDFTRVRLVISQPRARVAPSEWDTSVEALVEWADTRARATIIECEAARADVTPYLSPGEKQCRFCRAKATCPALREEVAFAVAERQPMSPEEFRALEPAQETDAEWISAALDKVDMIEDWCKAIRTEAERRLQQGQSVPGWKLVPGKRGARQWSNPAAVEEMLRKRFRLTIEQAYDLKLISPTSAEKLKKSGVLGDRQWSSLTDLITQSEGKAHVAPASDPRPAIVVTPAVEDFADLTLA